MQLYYLTPKPSFVPEMPKPAPYIGALFGSNILCILLHLIYARPEAGEATRGYLHGGLIIDFVGQQGPVWKLHLVALDLFVIALQTVMLSVHLERQDLKATSTPSESTNEALARATALSCTTFLPHEERRVRTRQRQRPRPSHGTCRRRTRHLARKTTRWNCTTLAKWSSPTYTSSTPFALSGDHTRTEARVGRRRVRVRRVRRDRVRPARGDAGACGDR